MSSTDFLRRLKDRKVRETTYKERLEAKRQEKAALEAALDALTSPERSE